MSDNILDLQKKIEAAKKKLKEKNKNAPAGKTAGAKPKKQKLSVEERLQKRLRNKLVRAISKAGLSWTAWSAIVEISDSINGQKLPFDTACWYYDEKTKKEKILITPNLMKILPVNLIVLVIKHEMLHKSMYRNIKGASNRELINIALDAAIQKILSMSEPKLMIKLSNLLYKQQRTGVMSVVNCSITKDERNSIRDKLQDIFDEIYWVTYEEQNRYNTVSKDSTTFNDHVVSKRWRGNIGNDFIPDPLTLYNKLAATLTKEEKNEVKKQYAHLKICPQNGSENGSKDKNHPRGGKDNLRAADKNTLEQEKKITGDIADSVSRGGGYSNYEALNAFFKKYVYQSKETDTTTVEDFARHWHTLNQVEGATAEIYKTIRRNVTLDPYPMELSRTGIEMVAIGVSGPQMPIYFNEDPEDIGGKKKIACYFDTSPSMNPFISYMVHVAEFFDSCDECEIAGGKFKGKYAFSEKVKGMSEEQWKEFIKGEVRGGCGTAFDPIIRHANERIEKDDVDIIVIFTDGYSSLSDEQIEKFNESGKKCYTLYFSHGDYSYYHSRHDQDSSAGMETDLDKLDGESFTINCANEKANV